MASEEKPPRSEVVVRTRDGRLLKPACPVCGEVSWGKLVPDKKDDPDKVETMILSRVGGKFIGMGIQVWHCTNCGHVWYRSGAVEQELSQKK